MNKKPLVLTIVIGVLVIISPFAYMFLHHAYLLSVNEPVNLWLRGANTITIQSRSPQKEWVFSDPNQIKEFERYLTHAEMYYKDMPSLLSSYKLTISDGKQKKTYRLFNSGLCEYYGSWGSTQYTVKFYKVKKGFWDYIIGLNSDNEKSEQI